MMMVVMYPQQAHAALIADTPAGALRGGRGDLARDGTLLLLLVGGYATVVEEARGEGDVDCGGACAG